MARLIHCLSLDTVGGVESVFADYLNHPKSDALEHHLMILNERCNPFFKSAVRENITTTTHVKYFGPFKLPKSIRSILAERHFNRVKACLRIVYNSLDNPSAWATSSRSDKIVYYERGGAWWTPPNLKTAQENLRRVQRFFCNSKASKRLLEIRYGVDSRLCDIIYNPSRFVAINAPTSKDLTQSKEFVFGMAGRLIPVKGMAIGLHALASLLKRSPHFRLVIAGDGPEMPTLQDTSRLLGIQNSVSFLGVVKDMRAFFASIDVFLCPSLREPFGNVVIEANGCGCPVVCANVDGLPEAMLPGKTGICLEPTLSTTDYLSLGVARRSLPELVYHPKIDDLRPPLALDPTVVANTLWDLAHSPESLQSLSREGYDRTRRAYHIDHYVERFHSLIKDCLRG